MIYNCPGAKRFKEPFPENITCPFCGKVAEIWTDETETVCHNCKKRITRKAGQNCLDWCKYAKECVGEEIYNNYMKKKAKK